MEVFGAAVPAIEDRISQADQGTRPLAFSYPPKWLVQSVYKSANEKILYKAGVKRPQFTRVVVVAGQRSVAIIARVENEERVNSIQLGKSRRIEAAYLRLSRTLERVVIDQHIEEKNRERKEICLDCGEGLTTLDLWGHEACRSDSTITALNADIIVVTNSHFASFGIKKDVSERNIVIAEPFGVELAIVVG